MVRPLGSLVIIVRHIRIDCDDDETSVGEVTMRHADEFACLLRSAGLLVTDLYQQYVVEKKIFFERTSYE